MEKYTYAASGVDISRAESFVERLKANAQRAGHERLWSGSGGYAAVYPVAGDRGIAVTTDGVGTKVLVASQLNRHDTIGIDLVAMCANDLICVGAQPTLFLDYYATGKLDAQQADALLSGIINGCDQAGMILVGGETAEMPDLYTDSHYDLAGFAIGEVSQSRLLTGQRLEPGQKLIGIASSGIHSNGLSLARKVLAGDRAALEQLLVPTLIYARPICELLQTHEHITGIAHITGGGWRNLLRLNKNVGFHINDPLPVPPILEEISQFVDKDEMYKTFNMGMGLCLTLSDNWQQAVSSLEKAGLKAKLVGTVTDQSGQVSVDGLPAVLTAK